jgi:hypothetical protein
MGRRINTWTAAVLAVAFNHVSYAGEGGQSEYTPGLYDLESGVLHEVGFYFKNYLYFQNPSTGFTPSVGRLETHADIESATDLVSGTYVTPLRLLGSNWAFAALMPVSYVQVSTQFQPPVPGIAGFDSTFSQGDAMLEPLILGWEAASSHFKVTSVIYARTGKYSTNEVANAGKNRWAVEEDFGYTLLDKVNGPEVSATLGYTVPFNNPDTQYTSGEELHLDFAAAQHLNWGLAPGLAGYWLQQTTADSGSGEFLGPYKGHVVGLGPLLSWASPYPDFQFNMVVKFYWDVQTANRLTGQTLWYCFEYKF